MPSLHQRRLWQREDQLEADARELNLLIARRYASQRLAARRVYSENFILLAYRLRVRIPARRLWARVLQRWARMQRSGRFERFIQRAMRVALWIQKHRW